MGTAAKASPSLSAANPSKVQNRAVLRSRSRNVLSKSLPFILWSSSVERSHTEPIARAPYAPMLLVEHGALISDPVAFLIMPLHRMSLATLQYKQ